MNLQPGRNVYLISWFIVSVLILTGGDTSPKLIPGRNVYLTSWFILSGLFLTGSDMSVVPTCAKIPVTQISTPGLTST